MAFPVPGGYPAPGYPSGETNGVAIQADGQILVAGEVKDSSGLYHFALLRVNGDHSTNGPAGTVDTGYGTAGWAVNLIQYTDSIRAVAIEPDGKAVTAGFAQKTSSSTAIDLVLLRFLPSAPQIGFFTATPNPAAAGTSIALTAGSITDGNPNSTIAQVTFYYFDNNGNQVTLGTGTQANGVWTLTFSTTGWAAGSYTLYAQATDSLGAVGDPFALTLTLL